MKKTFKDSDGDRLDLKRVGKKVMLSITDTNQSPNTINSVIVSKKKIKKIISSLIGFVNDSPEKKR